MPAAKPPEFRRRALDLVRLGEQPVAKIAKDLGISESCLRRWMDQDDVDAGRKDGLTSEERAELVRLRRENRGAGDGDRDPQARVGVLRSGEHPPKMIYPAVQELSADGSDVAVACRVLSVSRSGFYEWQQRQREPSVRVAQDAQLTTAITEVHRASRGCYGSPRVHAELRLGLGMACGRKRVARLMRAAGLAGIGARRKRRHRPATAVHDDLVQRRFAAAAPNRLWCTDITEHPTSEGKVYCCAILDVYSRVIVGWSIADHMRSELVVDALEMARWRRRPEPGAIVHADRGSQYTSWTFGHRLRTAGLLGSMGRVASSVDNTMIESFWSSMQRELLDRRSWATRHELATAIFEWIEAFYNPVRRHSALDYLIPVDYEEQHTTTAPAA